MAFAVSVLKCGIDQSGLSEATFRASEKWIPNA